MKRAGLPLITATLLLVACAPSTKPSAETTTHPALKIVDLTYFIYLASSEDRITVSPDGALHVVHTYFESMTPERMVPGQIEIREGVLTPEQMKELVRLFDGFDQLIGKDYGAVADGPDFTIHYGDLTLHAGAFQPRRAYEIYEKLGEWSALMPRTKVDLATRPATTRGASSGE